MGRRSLNGLGVCKVVMGNSMKSEKPKLTVLEEF